MVETIAKPQAFTENDVKKMYPSDLSLKMVQIIHRHGERTPIVSGISWLLSPIYNNCQLGSFFAINSHASGGVGLNPASNKANLPIPITTQYQKALHNVAIWDEDIDDDNHSHEAGPGICYHGQLTDQGRLTMTKLGANFRSLYVDKLGFLPKTLDRTDFMYLRSSDFPRTLESLHSVLEGLYPQSSRHAQFHNTPGFQIYSRTPNRTDIIYIDYHCKKYSFLKKQFQALIQQEYEDELKTWPEKLQSLAKADKHGPLLAVDVLTSAFAHGWNVDLTTQEYAKLRSMATKVEFGHMSRYPEFPRLMIGRFAQELFELMDHHVNPSFQRPDFSMHTQHMRSLMTHEPPKLAFYSGHDTTLLPLLAGLGIWNKEWPPFASHLVFELFETKSKESTSQKALYQPLDSHYVRVRYNDASYALPGCDAPSEHYPGDPTLCTYTAFKRIMKEFTLTRKEYAQACIAPDA